MKNKIQKIKMQFNAFELLFDELKKDLEKMIAELESLEGSNDSKSVDMAESRQQDSNALSNFKSFANLSFSKFKEKATEAGEAIKKSGVLDKVKEKTSELASKGLEKSKELVEKSKKEKGGENAK